MARDGTTGIRVVGLKQLIAELDAVGVDLADLKAVFSMIAKEAATVAAQLAPVQSGRLRRSIKGSKSRNYAAVTAGRAGTVPYAGAINYGWPRRNIRGSFFMQRADMLFRPRAEQLIRDGVAYLLHQRGLS